MIMQRLMVIVFD